MHTISDFMRILTVFTRTVKLVGSLPECPGLPEEFEPFLTNHPSPADLAGIEPRRVPFAIVALRNAVQQTLGGALSCDELDVVIRLDSIHQLNPQT